MDALNGWTAEKLYDLKQKVETTYDKLIEIEGNMGRRLGRIEDTLRQRESEETQSLRDRVRELEEKPHRQLATFVVPFACACIPAVPALLVLLNHA